METQRAHVIRLNPTPKQAQYFLQAAGVARFTYNWALAEYRQLKGAQRSVDWNAIKKTFRTHIDTDYPFVREVTKCAHEQAIADLRQAINTYYKTKDALMGTKAGRKLRFPGPQRRKKKIGGFGLANDKFWVKGHDVYVPKLGTVNMAEPLRLAGKILSGRVTEKAGHWYLSVTVQVDVPAPLNHSCASVGIDFGLSVFATLSTGEVVETQKHFRQSERTLRLLQRGLSRKQQGSRNYKKWNQRVARCHVRIANQRKDFLHKFTTNMAQRFEVICVEDLSLAGLMQTRLAKSFADGSIGEGVRQLHYKAAYCGGEIRQVHRFFPSSKRCHVCGWINESLTLADRVWSCPQCGITQNRDLNAAVNIELEGMGLPAGSGYVGVTPVELRTTTAGSSLSHVCGDEAGTNRVHLCAPER